MWILKIFLVATLTLSLTFPQSIVNTSEVNPYDKLTEAFEAVYKAESMGGNITVLVEDLNKAITLLEKAEETGNKELKSEALKIMENVLTEAPKVGEAGEATIQNLRIQAALTITALIATSIVLWRYLPRLIWHLWIRSKKRWKAKL